MDDPKKTDWTARRAAIIRQAEEAIERDRSVSGATIMIPRPDGTIEEHYLPRSRPAARQ